MLLKKETLESFGIDIDKLTDGSKKKVKIKCDYCSKIVDVEYKNRVKSYNKLPKDACNDCKYIKREEIGNNPFSRPEVKEKIKQHNLMKYGVEHWVQSDEFNERIGRKDILSLSDFAKIKSEETKGKK